MSIPDSSLDPSLLGKIACYTEILAKDAHSTAFVPLSDAYRQMGLLDDALEVVEKGVKALPRFSPGYVSLGRICFERGDIPAAAAAFESAYTIDSLSLPAIKGWAHVLIRQGNHGRAREILEKALTLNPGEAGICRMLASLPARAMSQPADIVPQAEPVKTTEPIATSTIAEIYLKQGFPERALKVYLDLQASHPDNRELQHKIAEVTRLIEKVETPEMPSNAGAEFLPQAPQVANLSAILSPSDALSDNAISARPFPDQLKKTSEVDRQLEALNRWLTAIRARRQHVQ